MKTLIPLAAAATLAVAACTPAAPPEVNLGLFTDTDDVGTRLLAGDTAWDAAADTYTVSGSGDNMWADRDDFRFVWRKVGGDFILRTRAGFIGDGGHEHRKFGVIARTSTDPSAEHVAAVVHGDALEGLSGLQYRASQGGETLEQRAVTSFTDVVELRREGNRFTASFARFGEAFENVVLEDRVLPDSLLVGLFVCAHDSAAVESVLFEQVRLVTPAGADLTPYRDYLGSRLEILDTETGDRRVVHTDPGSIQAPNWTPDGTTLIFNRAGLLYRFDLATGDTTRIDTGFATDNNNDHVLTFDGTQLGISHHVAEEGRASIIFRLPTTGGVPTRVTPLGPSYFHGWSPDAQTMVYTGGREGEYDIYAISADGGDEVRLTDTIGLDDGPEYTPDGEWIWFNSVRSGTMQLWRMRPDGSGAERMTESATNDWFPHISPDGQQVAFLAFGQDVDPGDHPFYKHVTIKVMPAQGGPARVVAYLYGGQGTINVPSWAPDSRRLAFVSNTGTF